MVGVPSAEFGKEIAALVRLSQPVDVDALLHFARARLPRPRWPRQIVVGVDLPRNSSGKILKRQLAERIAGIQD